MAQPAESPRIIDTHLHLIAPSRFRYGWLTADSPLYREFRLDEIRAQMQAANISGAILIEATNTPDEIAWLLDVCAADPICKGVIGWIDLGRSDAPALIRQHAENPFFKGVRLNWFAPCPELSSLRPALHALQGCSLVLELLTRVEYLPEIAEFVRAFPAARLVIDHMGGAAFERDGLADWQIALRKFTDLPKVCFKFSGFPEQSAARHYLHSAIEAIGARRLMFGSNWPVCPDYARTVDELHAAAQGWDAETRAALFSGTAQRVYGVSGVSHEN
jgi:L-fuconolactonase